MYIRGRKNLTQADAIEFAEAMAKVDFNDPSQRKVIAETIVKELRDEIEKDDILNLLGVEVVNFAPGQTVQFITRKGMKAYVHEPGSVAPRSTITNRTQTLTTELVSVHPEMEIGQLQSGRYGSVQEIKDMALEELKSKKYGIIWNTLIGSIASTATTQYQTYASTVSTLVKKNALDSGLDYVADRQGSYPTAIVGRRNSLGWLADYPGFSTYGQVPSEPRKEYLDNSLYPPTYRGVPVVMLNQYTDGWGTNVITESEVMILGANTMKMGHDRLLDFAETIDVDTLMWHIHMFESYGFAVFNATRNYRLHIT